MGTESAERDRVGWISTPPYPREILPTPDPDPEARRANSLNVRGSRNQGEEWSACPPKAKAEGIRVPGNQSCRASCYELPAGLRTRARDPGWTDVPGACRERWPRSEQVVRRRQSRPHGFNFPAAWRGNGTEKAREAGREGRCAALGTVCVCREAPRLGLCSPPDQPPRASCLGAGHRRVSPLARRLIRGAPAAQEFPWAVSSLLAACRLQLQARRGLGRRASQTSRDSAPPLSMPGTRPPRPPGSASGGRRKLLLAEHRASSPRPFLPSSRRCRSSPRSTFLRFLRPARPPPPRPRLLPLPPSPPAAPNPRPPGRAAPLTPSEMGYQDPCAPHPVLARTPGSGAGPARRSGHEYFSAGEAALCRCHGTGCCGNSTNPSKGQGGGPRKRPQVRAGAVPRRASRRPGEGHAEGWGPGRLLPAPRLPPNRETLPGSRS